MNKVGLYKFVVLKLNRPVLRYRMCCTRCIFYLCGAVMLLLVV